MAIYPLKNFQNGIILRMYDTKVLEGVETEVGAAV